MKLRFLLIIPFMSVIAVPYANANLGCFKKPDNYEQGKAVAPDFDVEKSVKEGYESIQNPAQDLLMCHLQAAIDGPEAVLKMCGCREAVKELCKFKWDDGSITTTAKEGAEKAWCVPFAPYMI